MWAKVDDHLHAHPKVRAVWLADPAALGLHLLALSYTAAYLTDGRIPEEFVREQMPAASRRRRALSALIAGGLWESNGAGGYLLHDYLEFNPSRRQVERKRAAQRAGGKRGALARWGDS